MTGEPRAGEAVLRFATLSDVDAVAALHASRIREGFLVTLGPAFLRRLYRRVVLSARSFVVVAIVDGEVCGFVGVAENTGALYREFLRHDVLAAAASAVRGIVRRPGAVLETLRYGLRGGEGGPEAEILATGVGADQSGRGIGTRLVREAVAELERRGVRTARVVTAVGNVAALRTYERGGFHRLGVDEVHRGVPQELLVWP